MGELLFEERKIVIPGEELAKGMDHIPGEGAFREKESIFSLKLGLASLNGRLIKVIPLKGKYIPKEGDNIIGSISDITLSGWRVKFGWAFDANISLKDGTRDYVERGSNLAQYYSYEDHILGKIIKIAGSRIIDISMTAPGARKLRDGRIIECIPSKVPRIIGKQGSMISLLKEKTNCNILVGQNGLVWLSGEKPEDEILAVKAIRKIEKLAHLPGLTEEIKKFLEGEQ